MFQLLTEIQAELTLFFLGGTAVMLLFALLQWVQIRDRSLLIYTACCTAYLVYFARNTSLSQPVFEMLNLTEEAFWRYTENTLGLGMCTLYMLFVYYFLKYPKRFSKRVLWPIWVVFGVYGLIFILDWYFLFVDGDFEKSTTLQQYAQWFILPPQAYMIVLGFTLKNIVSRIVILGYLVNALFLSLFLTYLVWENPSLSFFPPKAIPSAEYRISMMGMQLGILIENTFFLYAFVYRIRIFQNERDKAYRDLWLKQQESKHLVELETQKDRFFTNISHEFRTPLTAILGSAEQLTGNGTLKQRIERNGRQLLHMVNQILDLSKLREGKRQPEWVQADIIAYLKFLADPFRSLALSKRQNFLFHTDLPQLRMDFDPDMIQSIFSNLVGNALKFTPEYGAVKVIASRTEKQFLLEVIDTGPGISEEIREYIFERYYRAAPSLSPSKRGRLQADSLSITKSSQFTFQSGNPSEQPRARRPSSSWRGGEGAGIGLWLVRELTILLEGEISVDSKPGTGSRFTVCLPIRRKAPVKNISRPDTTPVDFISNGFLGKKRKEEKNDSRPVVLIVEDNPDIIAYLREILEERYQTRHARHGKAALEQISHHRIDLVLCDLMMPEMDGMELCRTLRQNTQTRQLPLLMITARSTQTDKLRGLEAGADAYLTKPFDRRELLLRIDKLLRIYGQNGKKAVDEELSAFREKLNTAIEENLDNELFNVNHLCRTMHLARPTLNKKVKAATGLPPGEYLRRKRLQHARRLLEMTDLPVAAVAQEVGFKTPSHFSTAFKAHYGVSPAKTRK